MHSPFSDPPLPTPWWLRSPSDQELVRHRQLMDELTKLEGPDDGPEDDEGDEEDDI